MAPPCPGHATPTCRTCSGWPTLGDVWLAADIGQANVYTALVGIKSYPTVERYGEWPDEVKHDRRHDLLHGERFRDLSYPAQIERKKERYDELRRIATEDNAHTRIVVDATGVGKPILDALREGGIPRVKGVIITGGDATSEGDGVTRVPERVLVTSLQVALQAKRSDCTLGSRCRWRTLS